MRTGAAALLHVAIAETEHTKEAAQTEAASIERCLCSSPLPSPPSRISRFDRDAARLAALLAMTCFRLQAPSLAGAEEHVSGEVK